MPRIRISTGRVSSVKHIRLEQALNNKLFGWTQFFTGRSFNSGYFLEGEYRRIWTIQHSYINNKRESHYHRIDKRYLTPQRFIEKYNLTRGIEKWV